MNRTFLLAAVFSATVFGQVATEAPPAPPATGTEDTVAEAIKGLTASDIEKHLRILASPEFEGRMTATPGQEKAAAYAIEHMKFLGLVPMGDAIDPDDADAGRSWIQKYPVVARRPSDASGLWQGETKLHRLGAWLFTRDMQSGERSVEIQGAPVYLDRVAQRDDLDDLDLTNKIPIAVMEMDRSKDGEMDIMKATMTGFNEFARLRLVARRLKGSGATAAVIIFDEPNLPFLCASGMFCVSGQRPGLTQGNDPNARDPDSMAGTFSPAIPLLLLGKADAHRLTEILGFTPESVFGANAERPKRGALPLDLRLTAHQSVSLTHATNVAGVLPGRDPELAREALVYSCHMDHEGVAPEGTVFLGADDNGSGTATVMEIAEAFASLSQEQRPARSILFLVVSGEERGLWGSEWFSDNPTWPLPNLIADINMDMIGRSTDKVPSDTIAVTPTFRHDAYSTLAQEASVLGREFGLAMASGDKFYERSDHYNFARKGVPIVFFTDDEHADYHLPTDSPDRIEYDKLERVGRLAFLLGYRAANRPERPETLGRRTDWEGEKAPPGPRRRRGGGR